MPIQNCMGFFIVLTHRICRSQYESIPGGLMLKPLIVASNPEDIDPSQTEDVNT